MTYVGYEFLRERLNLSALPHWRAAVERPVTRILGYLWESLTGRRLTMDPPVGGNYVEVFDPEEYGTRRSQRDARWRVDFISGP